MSKPLNDKELKNELIDLLEPHYWNKGFEAGREAKEAVEKSVTLKVLFELIHSQKLAHGDMVIGEHEPIIDNKYESPFKDAVQRLNRNDLRSEQHGRNK